VTGRLRVLFASTHGVLDPSSGAALCTRDLLELLAARGHDCRAVSTGVLDFEADTPLDAALAELGVALRPARAELGGGDSVEVRDGVVHGVRVTLVPTRSSRAERAPDPDEAAAWLALAERAIDRFRPHALLTYGGHPAGLELMRRARLRGVRVLFHLHNFAYDDPRVFTDASAAIVPSEYARRFYRERVGVDGIVLPDPLRPERVVAADPEPAYVTFVNPQPAKGVTVFARIALELGRRRPDIPLLVVEGRGGSDWLARVPLDLSGLANLHRMANTPEPRDFWRVTRAVLMPSLWRESLGRVAMEGLANGLPVLAGERGALPGTLGDAGFVFALPERCEPGSAEVPTAREVAPWVRTIERLWDDAAFEAEHRARARAEAGRWAVDPLLDRYEAALRGVAGP
jgi:glycosyltransferase involved in cell wall biosynthesis